MGTSLLRLSLLLSTLLAAACGSNGSNGDDDNPAVDAPDTPTPDAPPIPDGFTRLIGRTWTIQPGTLDSYKCVRVTLTEDTYVTNIVAQAPVGTHHTVLSIASNNGSAGPDGEQDCGVNTLGMQMLYASGVGTSPLDFPAGVGLRLEAGTQIHLNLHLFNATDQAISGDSAILVKQQATPPPMLAEMVFAGTFNISIPSNNQPTTVTGGCTSNRNYQMFALWPHMHQIATHQKIELVRGGNTTVLHDLPYQFAEQEYYLQSPEIAVQQGDQLRVSCTYVNNTGQTVTFGDSSNKEMCFAGIYRYPAADAGLFECAGF